MRSHFSLASNLIRRIRTMQELRQVLRIINQTGRKRRKPSLKAAGGLLVLLWTETEFSAERLNCTVAASGPWCAGNEIRALHPVADLRNSLFPCMCPCSEPDPEELSAFTDLYGSLKLLLTFQIKDSSKWQIHTEGLLRMFSLTNAGIRIHLKFKFGQQTLLQELGAKIKKKVTMTDQPPLILDVTCSVQPPCVKKGCWCRGGHPVIGGGLPLSLPPTAMDGGLFGELSVHIVTLLSPCVLLYPNLPSELTRIQVLLYSPSNIPVPGPLNFFKGLPAALDCQQLGLDRIHCSSVKGSHADLLLSGGFVYTVEQQMGWRDPEQESSHVPVQQTLLLLLLLQHSDPFTSELTDIIAAEMLIERHLDEILSNNQRAVATALQTELCNALKTQQHRKKQQEKLQSAAEGILRSTISIISSSSNLDFRNACLKSMKVQDTYELSASLRESLWKVTTWKFLPRNKCYSAEVGDQTECNEPNRAEI